MAVFDPLLVDGTMSDKINSLGLYASSQIDEFNSMSIFGYYDIHNRRDNTKEYVFFTKPDLNILGDSKGNSLNPQLEAYPIFADMFQRRKNVLASLNRSCKHTNGEFIDLLFNRRVNSLDLPTITSKEVETSANVYGTSITYRKHSLSSDENHEFTVDFTDNASNDVYNLFKVWDEYNNLKNLGIVSPAMEYIIKRKSHDKIAIFKFIVADDNETIIFYSKFVGVRPTGVPREAFSDLTNSTVYSVPFKADFVIDSNPLILEDFNQLAKSGTDIKLYDTKGMHINPEFAKCAYVAKDSKRSNGLIYKLKWRK